MVESIFGSQAFYNPYLVINMLSMQVKEKKAPRVANSQHLNGTSHKDSNFSRLKNLDLSRMAIPVLEFSREGYKIRKVFC